jgi:hypothetical protein
MKEFVEIAAFEESSPKNLEPLQVKANMQEAKNMQTWDRRHFLSTSGGSVSRRTEVSPMEQRSHSSSSRRGCGSETLDAVLPDARRATRRRRTATALNLDQLQSDSPKIPPGLPKSSRSMAHRGGRRLSTEPAGIRKQLGERPSILGMAPQEWLLHTPPPVEAERKVGSDEEADKQEFDPARHNLFDSSYVPGSVHGGETVPTSANQVNSLPLRSSRVRRTAHF